MPGMGKSPQWWSIYEKIRKTGKSKESSAKITNTVIARLAAKRKGLK